MIIDQLNRQSNELMELLGGHNCQAHNKVLPQHIRHIQSSNNKDPQQLLYNGCNDMMQQQQLHLKMEPSNDISEPHLQSEMEGLFKDDQLGTDRSSSPINDTYPITTCSMITNNDPGITYLNELCVIPNFSHLSC